MLESYPKVLPLIVAVAAALLLPHCATNPATGQRQLMLVSEGQEVQMGRSADPQIVAQFGLYPDEQIQSYVNNLGQKLAAESERPDLPWTFRVLDDPVVNAFALPGGFIYVTRGILTHFNTEAELVGVLGHEIGHVTARHGANQMSKSQLAGLGLGVGMILSPELAQFGDLAQTGLGLLFLKFGRDAERQADELGFRYVSSVGYPPAALGEVFDILGRVSSSAGGDRLPNWLSTHPAPENRRGSVDRRLADLPPELRDAPWYGERYLDQLAGMTFGPNPREGYFQGSRFYHPELAFQLDFPEGWETHNLKQSVVAMAPDKDVIVQLTLSGASTPEEAAQTFLGREGIETGPSWLNRPRGFKNVSRIFRATSGENQLRGGVSFIQDGERVYQILGYSLESRWSRKNPEVAKTVASFSRVKDRRVLNVKPMQIDLVTLRQAMDLREFDRRYPSSVDLDQLALINHVEPDTRLAAGRELKRVTGFNPAKSK